MSASWGLPQDFEEGLRRGMWTFLLHESDTPPVDEVKALLRERRLDVVTVSRADLRPFRLRGWLASSDTLADCWTAACRRIAEELRDKRPEWRADVEAGLGRRGETFERYEGMLKRDPASGLGSLLARCGDPTARAPVFLFPDWGPLLVGGALPAGGVEGRAAGGTADLDPSHAELRHILRAWTQGHHVGPPKLRAVWLLPSHPGVRAALTAQSLPTPGGGVGTSRFSGRLTIFSLPAGGETSR